MVDVKRVGMSDGRVGACVFICAKACGVSDVRLCVYICVNACGVPGVSGVYDPIARRLAFEIIVECKQTLSFDTWPGGTICTRPVRGKP